jgi:hypothetical protein
MSGLRFLKPSVSSFSVMAEKADFIISLEVGMEFNTELLERASEVVVLQPPNQQRRRSHHAEQLHHFGLSENQRSGLG